MNAIAASMHAHQVLWTLGSYFVFASAVGAMPTPTDKNGPFYHWAFTFLTTLSAGIARVVATKAPQSGIGQALIGGSVSKTV